MKKFDTHCHINLVPLLDNSAEHLAKLSPEFWVNLVGVDLETSQIALDLAAKTDYAVVSIGIHPKSVKEYADIEKGLSELRLMAVSAKVKCFGEVGLDYTVGDEQEWNQQRLFLTKIVALANELRKPLNIHCRDAFIDLKVILADIKVPFIMHCFAGSVSDMHDFVKLGGYISVAGVVTFKNAQNLRNVVMEVPIDRLLAETDAPFLAPEPFRGKINQPEYIAHTISKIAAVINESEEEVGQQLFANAKRVFNI